MTEITRSPRPLTGGQAVQTQEAQKSLVDWVQATFKGKKTWAEIVTILGLEKVAFSKYPTGFYGYPNMYGMGNINIMYNDDMTEIHVQMTGQGCRMFETVSSKNWRDLFTYIHEDEDAKFTRLDLAIDDFKGLFTIPTIRRKMTRGELVTKFLDGDSTAKFRFASDVKGNSPVVGDGVRFGSPSSRLMIRMYDKVKERENAGFEVSHKKWVRTELQLRKEYANLAVAELIENDFHVGEVAKGYLKDYIRFVDQPNTGKDTRKRRWPVSNFWKKFLGKVEPLKLSLQAPDATIERSIAWVDHSVVPTLAMINETMGPAFYSRFVLNATKVGKERWKDKHEVIVNDFKQREKMAKMMNETKMNEYKQKMTTLRKKRSHNQNETKKMKLVKHNMLFKEYSMNSRILPQEDATSVLGNPEPRIKLLN